VEEDGDVDGRAGLRSTAPPRNTGRKCVWSDAYVFSKRELTKTKVCMELPNWKTYKKQHYTQSCSVFVNSLIAHAKIARKACTERAVM
jgi:ribosomal protein S26